MGTLKASYRTLISGVDARNRKYSRPQASPINAAIGHKSFVVLSPCLEPMCFIRRGVVMLTLLDDGQAAQSECLESPVRHKVSDIRHTRDVPPHSSVSPLSIDVF